MSNELLSSLNKVGELPDNVLDGIAQIHQRINKWKRLEELSIAKEYVDGHIGIVVELNREPSPQLHHSSAAIWPHAKLGICHLYDDATIWVSDFEVAYGSNANDGREKLMLINIVELIESEQFLSRPTWICRKSDKEFLRIVTGCFYSLTRGFIVELGLAEFKACSGVLCTSIQANQSPCGMIEGSSQIMDRISQDEREDDGYFLAESDLDGESASVRIVADTKRMGVGLHLGFKLLTQRGD